MLHVYAVDMAYVVICCSVLEVGWMVGRAMTWLHSPTFVMSTLIIYRHTQIAAAVLFMVEEVCVIHGRGCNGDWWTRAC